MARHENEDSRLSNKLTYSLFAYYGDLGNLVGIFELHKLYKLLYSAELLPFSDSSFSTYVIISENISGSTF